MHDLVESSAGHLMLPCSCFDAPIKNHEEATCCIVGDHFDATPESEVPSGASASALGGAAASAQTSVSDSRMKRAESFSQMD